MNVKQLEYVVKIQACGSITQAAQQLAVSQPNLTKAISNLEQEYGIRILNRKARGVEFTEQGMDFVLYAKGVLAVINAYPKAAAVPLMKARLYIAAQQLDFIHPMLVEATQQSRSGNLYFNLVETDRSNVVELLLKGTVDLGFAVRTSADTRDQIWRREAHRLEIQVLAESRSAIAVGPKSPFWNRSSVKLEELSACLHVALDLEEQAKQSYWFTRGQYIGYNNNRMVFVNTVAGAESFLLRTDAINYCSYWTRGCFQSPDIHFVPVEDDTAVLELLMLRRRGEQLSEAEAAFAEAVCRRFGVEQQKG